MTGGAVAPVLNGTTGAVGLVGVGGLIEVVAILFIAKSLHRT